MAYEPNEWSCGDTVTAEKLNAMERGISDMNADYVPTEWVCGDVITAEKLNHMEQGIANGCEGGGSSDFRTAQVTFVNNTSDPISSIYVCVYDAPFSAAVAGNVFSTGSVDYNVPLYKGVCYWAVTDSSVNVSVSGDVEWDSENGGLLITGDCTITIS